MLLLNPNHQNQTADQTIFHTRNDESPVTSLTHEDTAMAQNNWFESFNLPAGTSKPRSKWRAAAFAAALAGYALMLAGCATVSATSTQYVGAPHPAPSDPAKVEILRAEPTHPFDRLGEISVDASVEPSPPIADIEAKVRSESAKLGADAVVIVLDRVVPTGVYVSGPWWGRNVDTITGRKLIGVAIKYK